MDHITLPDLVRNYVVFPGRYSATGWNSVLCRVCHDHGEKGNRGGFKFDNEIVAYNCFNCGHAASFDPSKHSQIPEKMVTVLQAFDIPEKEWQKINLQQLGQRVSNSAPAHNPIIEPQQLDMPSFWHPVVDNGDEWNEIAIEYLKDRQIDYKSYQFYLAKKNNHPDSKRWHGRLIIPIYKDKKLVFYQGRDLSDTQEQKYLSPNVSKGTVISGYENITTNSQSPLYITEGWFDSFHIQGSAIFGKKLYEQQILLFKRTNRPKVIIPDKTGGGKALGLQALRLGWSVSLPDIGSCTDINMAIQRYGQLYVRKTIFDNTFTGAEAEANLTLYCQYEERRR